MSQAASVTLRGVHYSYGGSFSIEGVDLDIAAGELITMVGPSGCGKSTLLRIVAGLLHPDQGAVMLDGEDVVQVSPERRNIGWMPQSYALFEHLDVTQNIAFGLRMRGVKGREQQQRVAEMLDLCQILDLADRSVAALSGGQRQRVAIARALAVRPRVLLLDEPLAALDPQLRIELRSGLERLLHDSGVTTLFVTHDQSEALALADRVAVLRAGVLHQFATPEEVWEQPADDFVASFFGHSMILPTQRLSGGTLRVLEGIEVDHPGTDTPRAVLRASDLIPTSSPNGHPVAVTAVEYGGQGYKVSGRAAAGMELRFTSEVRPSVGDRLHVALREQRLPAWVKHG